ncbi:L-arabinose transport system permease protein AraQ [Paenibacillus allorhizoplanae]|uniref:L-arabinose transport system permease protein AraQ n=1 Tax=Paenibacillus allorhizoplanae TaxID=2905648 RepID=A0ABM9C036_9BACL|nr:MULTISPECIES: carbohydrate ABC transporter permease [Paenibacillus]KRE70070.1 sugar ABC transporter permease [Paenibacillus sp. Soil750]CAH1200130.1 L-arabinose transport system permease protein AraQ [Paenibacillus allorhizoplanae]
MKTSYSDRVFYTVNHVLLILLVIVTLYPLIYVTFASISDGAQLITHKGLLYRPLGFSLEAYHNVFKNPSILQGYRNTLFILVFGVTTNLIVTALGAYVLSRKNVMWNKVFIFIVILTMFFSGGLVPMYLVVKGVGLIDSLWATILPFAVNTFNLIIMRTAFMAVPESLEESAKMDGANHFVILFKIIIPLSMPVIAVMILYYAVEKWNGWFWASIFLKDRELYPLQLTLREILIANNTDMMSSGANAADQHQIGETIKYATIMVASVPILILYPFVQKYFVKGVMIGAVKG